MTNNGTGWIVAIIIALALLAIAYLVFTANAASDDTGRSGMGLYTDARTGCEYLGTYYGGFTPRMDRDGKQICAP